MNLVDRFFSHPYDSIPWKIYDYHSRRKLSNDYGAELADDYYDYMKVKEIKLKTNRKGQYYYRVTVY